DTTVKHPPVFIDSQHRMHATISCEDVIGEEWVTFDALRTSRSEQAALFPVYCHSSPPETFRVELTSNVGGLVTPREMGDRLASIVNRERRDSSLPPLGVDVRLADAARDYANALRVEHRLTHKESHDARAIGMTPAVAYWTAFRADDLEHAAELILNDV